MARMLSPKKNEPMVGPLRRGRKSSQRVDRSTDRSIENLIVIGASAGGHQALRQVIRGLSADIPAAIIILLHMSSAAAAAKAAADGSYLEEWLRLSTQIPVVKAKAGDRLRQGVIFIVPPATSVWVKGRLLQTAPQEEGPVVTINTLFESAAREFGHRTIGVILTGLLRDGTEGLKAVHEAGGITIVQDPKGAEFPDMPANAMKDLPVTFCLGLGDIGMTLDLLARRKTELETGLAFSVRGLKKRVAFLTRLIAQSKSNLVTSEFLTIEMTALERDLRLLERLVAQALVEGKADVPSPGLRKAP